MLIPLLQNAYNAHWPEDFNATSFCLPNPDADAIQSSKDINGVNFSSQEIDAMAEALLHENDGDEIKQGNFYRYWLMPIKQQLDRNKYLKTIP